MIPQRISSSGVRARRKSASGMSDLLWPSPDVGTMPAQECVHQPLQPETYAPAADGLPVAGDPEALAEQIIVEVERPHRDIPVGTDCQPQLVLEFQHPLGPDLAGCGRAAEEWIVAHLTA